MKLQFKSVNARLFSYFLFLMAAGAAVFQLPGLYVNGSPVSFIDGLFTAVSAICVTGLSTVDMDIFNAKGLAAILFFIEAGGFGLVTFFSLYLVFPSQKVSLINRKIIRDYFIYGQDLNVWQILARILGITVVFQILGAAALAGLLSKAGEPHFIFYGVFLSISAFCNAGFAPYNASLCGFSDNYSILAVICLLVICGGLGFSVISNIMSVLQCRISGKKSARLNLHSKIVFLMTGILIVSGTVIVFLSEQNAGLGGMKLPQKIWNSFFESVTLRTAGFETFAQSSVTNQTCLVSLFLMLTGGSPGSMSGGLKTTTLFLLLCYTFRNSKDKDELSVFKRDISWSTIEKSVSIFMKYICILLVSMFLLCVAERNSAADFSFTDLIFESVSAFGTVGLSRNVTKELSLWGKIIVMATMFAGRTGLFAMVMSSRRKNILSLSDYPREDVLVG